MIILHFLIIVLLPILISKKWPMTYLIGLLIILHFLIALCLYIFNLFFLLIPHEKFFRFSFSIVIHLFIIFPSLYLIQTRVLFSFWMKFIKFLTLVSSWKFFMILVFHFTITYSNKQSSKTQTCLSHYQKILKQNNPWYYNYLWSD